MRLIVSSFLVTLLISCALHGLPNDRHHIEWELPFVPQTASSLKPHARPEDAFRASLHLIDQKCALGGNGLMKRLEEGELSVDEIILRTQRFVARESGGLTDFHSRVRDIIREASDRFAKRHPKMEIWEDVVNACRQLFLDIDSAIQEKGKSALPAPSSWWTGARDHHTRALFLFLLTSLIRRVRVAMERQRVVEVIGG